MTQRISELLDAAVADVEPAHPDPGVDHRIDLRCGGHPAVHRLHRRPQPIAGLLLPVPERHRSTAATARSC
ncbi:hypothetical protein GCM10009828_099680 [Actinoplanes couchii]|uniref:Uncharacterized protein n=1 Tax=Actinoplanes couchii TaxID=403638 RepID=A0ABQ3XPS0_9ACTN|nr:hypothetical protein Aco03nite_089160 [Actinoplanes couchii]